MSHKTIKPRYWAQVRRLARCIETPTDLERALDGLAPLERDAMLARLRPHLAFAAPAEPKETDE